MNSDIQQMIQANSANLITLLEANTANLPALINGVAAHTDKSLADLNDSSLTTISDIQQTIEANSANLITLMEANIANLIALINGVAAHTDKSLADLNDSSLTTILNQRVVLQKPAENPSAQSRTLLDPDPSYSYEKSLESLRQAAPDNFEEYLRCFNNGATSYNDLPPQSCSTALHAEAKLFAKFLLPYLDGRVLDIGCGPQSIPSYLSDYPVNLIAGIDPLPPKEQHPFMFVQGFAESLPWPDNSFECLVFGTTIDHYYLLDKGICEARRVLSANGFICIWITEFDDGTQIDPYTPGLKSYDHEHLYHINRRWFIPFMEKHGFEHLETFAFNSPFKYIFISFRKAS